MLSFYIFGLPTQQKINWFQWPSWSRDDQILELMIYNVYEPPHDKTNKMTVCPVKTQISLGIRPVWSESSLCAQWVAKNTRFLHADSEDSDQTGRMPRMIGVFAGRTNHFVGFVMRLLMYIVLDM